MRRLMATSDKPVETEEPLDATEEEWAEDEEDPTVSESIVPYEGGIVPRAQWDLPAVFAAFGGVALWTHDGKPALYYDVPNRGRGLTVRAMRILSAMRGGFEEVDLHVGPGQCFDAVIGPDGKPVIQAVAAVEATIRIRDLVAGNVRIGHWPEPVAKWSEKNQKYYIVPNPGMVAEAKAKRNAYAEHFSPIIEPLLKGIMDECGQKRVFFSGLTPTWVLSALPDNGEEGKSVPSAVDRNRARAEAAIGNAGRDEIADRLKPLEATFGAAIREEFVAWGTETFGTSVIARWPARRKPEIDAWFREKAEALGETLDGERVAGDEERPDPFEDAPVPAPEEAVDQEAILAAAVAGATDGGLSAQQILELKNLADLTRGKITAEKVADFVKRAKAAKPNGKAS